MAIDAMITATIIELLEKGIVIRTMTELVKVVSNMLDVRVSDRQIRKALNRNRHRITFEAGQFELTIGFRR